jgi:rubrerythrin
MNTAHVNMHIFLDACFEIERISAEIYHYFAELYHGDRGICLLWRKTAREEENHARQVELARKIIDSVSWVSLESWRTAAATLEGARQIAAMVRTSPPTLEDALVLALKCEKSMEFFHIENALKMKEPAGNRMFTAMMKEDRDHVRMLEAALSRLRKHTDDELELLDLALLSA